MSNFRTQALIFLLLFFVSTGLFIAFYNKSLDKIFFNNSEQFFDSKSPVSNFVPEPSPIITIFVFSDTHLNPDAFPFINQQIAILNPDIVFHIGDHTDYGDPKSLYLAKDLLQSLKIRYFVLPGDRDIAYSANDETFSATFKDVYSPNSIIEVKGVKFFLFSNMYNFTPFNDSDLNIIYNGLSNSDVVLSSQPIFIHPDSIFSNKYMGSDYFLKRDQESSEDFKIGLKKYITQSEEIRNFISKLTTSKLFISGDHHKSDTYTHPFNSLIKFHIVGSLAENIESGSLKLKQTALQSQRFSIINFFNSNGTLSYEIKEIEMPIETDN
jgi:predicted phosphodiesterase